MIGMRGWSFPIGRFLGVDVRIHTFFILLLVLSTSYASMSGASGGRGFALWVFLLMAVVVREIARAIAAVWFGLDLRSILLLPTGGLLSFATPEATERAATPEMQKRMAVIGPIANIGFGLLNMLPMLPLDGGHVAIALYERIRTRRGQPYYQADVNKLLPVVYGFMAVLAVVVVGMARMVGRMVSLL